MPRKQNGFGKAPSLAFKGAGRIDKGKGVGSFGVYPSNRRYGSVVHRTGIEHWDLNSDWTKWRKGVELWSRALYSKLRVETEDYDPTKDPERYRDAQLLSILYQGTNYPTGVVFEGYAFPTMKSDSGTNYVARRVPIENDIETGAPINISLGVVTNVVIEEEQKKYNEVWVQGTPDPVRGPLLLQMLNERVTDGDVEATLKNLLFFNPEYNRYEPGVYYGQTAPKSIRDTNPNLSPTRVKMTIPLAAIQPAETQERLYRRNQGLSPSIVTKPSAIDPAINPQELLGKVCYVPDFFKDRNVADLQVNIWQEDNYFMGTYIADAGLANEVYVLDPGVSTLPPSMYDINDLPQIISASSSIYQVTGTYIFRKSDYQRFYGSQYLVSDMVEERVQTCSYSILPFVIESAEVIGTDLVIQSGNFESEILMHPALSLDGILVFARNSFAKRIPTNNPKFQYALQTDVEPYMDQTFIPGKSLKPSVTYTCSCPNHSKSLLYAPQATYDQGTRKQNRQKRYPLPTAQGNDRFEGAGTQKASGKITSWEKPKDKQSLKMCKHSIAAMFTDGIKVIEPSQYPCVEARDAFDAKLKADLANSGDKLHESFERGEISLAEIVFALAQGLNLDNVETAYVVLNSN